VGLKRASAFSSPLPNSVVEFRGNSQPLAGTPGCALPGPGGVVAFPGAAGAAAHCAFPRSAAAPFPEAEAISARVSSWHFFSDGSWAMGALLVVLGTFLNRCPYFQGLCCSPALKLCRQLVPSSIHPVR